MNIYWRVGLVLAVLGVSHWFAYSTGADSVELRHANATLVAIGQRDGYRDKLTIRDQELAEAQARANQVRTETIIKTEVVYRDRIKNSDTRQCIADSGLLELYDATLGLSPPAK